MRVPVGVERRASASKVGVERAWLPAVVDGAAKATSARSALVAGQEECTPHTMRRIVWFARLCGGTFGGDADRTGAHARSWTGGRAPTARRAGDVWLRAGRGTR